MQSRWRSSFCVRDGVKDGVLKSAWSPSRAWGRFSLRVVGLAPAALFFDLNVDAKQSVEPGNGGVRQSFPRKAVGHINVWVSSAEGMSGIGNVHKV
jgi:hypothetical protein